MNYIAFVDFEFNWGYTYPKEEILSIGCVICDKSNRIVDTFYSLCRPKKHKKLPRKIRELTNITQEEANNAPLFDVVCRKFSVFLNKYNPDVFYTWGGHDRTVLSNSCQINRCKWFMKNKRFVDYGEMINKNIAKKNGKSLWRYQKSLTGIAEFYNQPILNAHNALNDAKMLSYIYRSYVERGTYNYDTNAFKKCVVTKKDLDVAKSVAENFISDESIYALREFRSQLKGNTFEYKLSRKEFKGFMKLINQNGYVIAKDESGFGIYECIDEDTMEVRFRLYSNKFNYEWSASITDEYYAIKQITSRVGFIVKQHKNQ